MLSRMFRWSFMFLMVFLLLAPLAQAGNQSICQAHSSSDYSAVTVSGIVANLNSTIYYANFDLQDNFCEIHVYWKFSGLRPNWLENGKYVQVDGQYRKAHPKHRWEPEIVAKSVQRATSTSLTTYVQTEPWTVTPWGAAGGDVAGSCYEVTTSHSAILVDCGSFMNIDDDMSSTRRAVVHDCDPLPFDPVSIDAIVVTHAHDDHIGRIHYLVAQGFKGKIYMTEVTKELYLAKLDDIVRYSYLPKDQRDQIEERIKKSIQTYNYHEPFLVSKGITATFINAAHIPGSASIILDLDTQQGNSTITFSGDIGSGHHPFLQPIDLDALNESATSTLIVESTYGGSPERSYAKDLYGEFFHVVNSAEKGQLVVIPTFALDRTQRVLAALLQGIRDGRLPDALRIGVGGKSSCYLTKAYMRFSSNAKLCSEYFSDWYCKSHIFSDHPWRFIRQNCDDSKSEREANPLDYDVIVTPSGTGSSSYAATLIKKFSSNPNVVFIKVGWAPPGSPMGASDGTLHVAAVQDVFSGHADIRGLLEYVQAFHNLHRIVITHGENAAREALAKRIKELEPSVEIVIPSYGDHIPIDH